MMRSLYSGVAGLTNHQTRMDVIGNNIANINTTGFKGSRVLFQEALNQSLSSASGPQGNRGGTNPQQIGLGMGIASIDTVFTDGSTQSTGRDTDLAISGNGFFVLSDGMKEYYTRNGAFDFDSVGNLVQNGMKLKGWMADANGNINTDGATGDIVVPEGITIPSQQTTKATGTGNLSAKAKAPSVETKTGVRTKEGDPAPTLGSKTTDENGVITEVTSTPVSVGAYYITEVDLGTGANAAAPPRLGDKVYNSAGALIGVVTDVGTGTFKYRTNNLMAPPGPGLTANDICYKDATDGTFKTFLSGTGATAANDSMKEIFSYDVRVTTPGDSVKVSFDAYDSQGIKHKVTGIMEKTGTNQWTFTPDTLAESGAVVTGTPVIITFDGEGKCTAGTGSLTIVPTDPPMGSNTLTLDLDFTAMTQYEGLSTSAFTADGYAAGTLEKRAFDSSGAVIGTFSNGQNRVLAQLAFAAFNNPAGLTRAGGSTYEVSNNSGDPRIGTAAGTGCKLTPSSLEMSNVNLSEQFSDMIVTQRGFQSNSKIITVSDEMIETLVGMKR